LYKLFIKVVLAEKKVVLEKLCVVNFVGNFSCEL